MIHCQVEIGHLLVHVRANWRWNSGYNSHLCRQMVKLSYTIFICYATCLNDVELVQMRGGTYNIHLLCNLCRWRLEHSTIFCYATCTDEGWNTVQYSFAMQLVQMRLIHAVEFKTQHYNGNQALPTNKWSWNARVKMIQPMKIYCKSLEVQLGGV